MGLSYGTAAVPMRCGVELGIQNFAPISELRCAGEGDFRQAAVQIQAASLSFHTI
jgi:hypothetical protein